MTTHPSAYEIRDRQLPHHGPLAYADSYDDAVAAVAELHRRLHAQLDANGEGHDHITQLLDVYEVTAGGEADLRHSSYVEGYH